MTGLSIPKLNQGSIFHKNVNSVLNDITPKIINLSDYNLTAGDISILKKGFNFCPTPSSPDFLDLEINLRDFIRLLLLKENFGSNNIQKSDYLVRKTGETLPKDSQDMLFNGVIYNLRKLSENLDKIPTKKKNYSNISKEEQKSLFNLRNNKDIIIKKADKGGNIVIMNTSYYVQKVNETLYNKNIYEKCKLKAIKSSMNRIKKFVKNNKKYFDSQNYESNYISNFDYNPSSFYGLPKIHKNEKIQNEVKSANSISIKMDPPKDLSFRFITAGPNSPNSKLSEFLDIILKPYLPIIPSYIRDTTDFLNKMPEFSNEEISDVQIVTCDVISLYPSLEQPLILKAVKYWLTNFPNLLNQRFDANFVLGAIEVVLKNSHFIFDDNCYNLKKGTATGTTVAPTLANLTMGFLEVDLYEKVYEEFGETIFHYVKQNWKRFLDDGQIFWRKSFGPIEKFVNILNSLNTDIHFTYDTSDIGLPFLNVYLYIENNKLLTDVFYKPTDSHDYLPFNSCHPRHIKINIPKTLARIICTIVDDPMRKLFRLRELKTWLLKAGYPFHLINNGFKQILQIDQAILRTKTVQKSTNILPFVQTHNPRNPDVYEIIVKAFNFLLTSEKYHNLLKDVKLIKSERQPKNLGRILQNSFFSKTERNPGVKKCNQKRCVTCQYLIESNSVNFDQVNINFEIKAEFTCESRNLIYSIFCSGCNKYYIGSTGNLRKRVSSHKGDVKKNSQAQLVHTHIFNCTANKNLTTPFRIIPFYKCKTKSFASRVACENYFRRKFKPQLNGY